MNWRRIFPIGTIAVLVTLSITGATCPTERQVDTSQRILLESGKALSSIDTVVARNIARASEEAIELVQEEMEVFEQNTEACIHESFAEMCPDIPDPMEIYQYRMEPWNRLAGELYLMSELLRTWERVNDTWRESGEQPTDFDSIVCSPFRELTIEIRNLLNDLEIAIPMLWQEAVYAVSEVCMMGAILAAERGDDSE